MTGFPWADEEELNLPQLVRHSMASADAIVSDKEHLERTTSHFNALLEDKPRQGGEQDDRDALKLMNRLFAATGKAMESDADRRRLALLKKYMGCLIGTSLGVDAFLPEEAKDDQNDGEEEDDQEEQQAGGRSWADIAQKQSSADKSFIIRQTRSFAADAAAARRERAHVRQWVKQCAYQSAEEEEQHFKGGFEPEYLPESSNFCMPLFFPSEQSYHTFITALKSAEETLYVCIFSLTDNTTARAIRDAHRRGVDVRIITDNEQLDNRGSDIMRLKEEEDIPTKQDNGDQFMHNKFAVVDNRIVITGSFNWSISARFKNRENVLITNLEPVVEAYHKEFLRLWDFF